MLEAVCSVHHATQPLTAKCLVAQGPEAARLYTDQLVAAAAQVSDQAEPLAQQFIDEQLKPTAQELARTLEPRVRDCSNLTGRP